MRGVNIVIDIEVKEPIVDIREIFRRIFAPDVRFVLEKFDYGYERYGAYIGNEKIATIYVRYVFAKEH